MRCLSQKPLRRNHLSILVLSLFLSAVMTSSCSVIPIIRGVVRDVISNTDDTGTDTDEQETIVDEDSLLALQAIDFDMFADSAAADTLSLHFLVKDPASLGLSIPEVNLGDVSKEKSDEIYEKYQGYLDKLEAINYEALPQQDQIMYDVIEYDLKEALDYQDYYYYSSPFNSITGLQTELPLVLSEYTFDDKQDVDDYLLLLKDLYRYYEDLMVFETERAENGLGASDTNLQKIIDSCESFLEDSDNHFLLASFSERLDTVDGLTEKEKSDYISQNQNMLDTYVFPAYELLIDDFTDLIGTGENEGGLYNVPEGKEYYTLLIKSQTSSDDSVKTITSRIERSMDDAIDILTETEIDSDFEEEYYSYNFSEGTVQENLDYCKAAIEGVFPEIMDHNVTLRQVPSQLEDFFSPAAYLSCTIDDPTQNVILTNTAVLADYQNLLETIAHEGYPGHLYESVYHAQYISSYYQRSASFIGYSEGWAEYAAAYILGASDYNQTLVSYIEAENQFYNILMPSRIDIGVNYEGWSLDDINDYLAQYNLTDMQEYAQYCYNMAIEIPCYYMPYCVGHLNTDSILTNMEEDLGDEAGIEEIHKAYLDIGPAPFPIVEKYTEIFVQNEQE